MSPLSSPPRVGVYYRDLITGAEMQVVDVISAEDVAGFKTDAGRLRKIVADPQVKKNVRGVCERVANSYERMDDIGCYKVLLYGSPSRTDYRNAEDFGPISANPFRD